MSTELRAPPPPAPAPVDCAHCDRRFVPVRLPRVPVARFCSVKCAEASRAARRRA